MNEMILKAELFFLGVGAGDWIGVGSLIGGLIVDAVFSVEGGVFWASCCIGRPQLGQNF